MFFESVTNIELVDKKRGLQEVRSLIGEERESVLNMRSQWYEYQIHFIFGLPMSFFSETFVSYISDKLTEYSHFYYTSFEGLHRVKNSPSNTVQSKNMLTIGDDIELMYDQLKEYKGNGVYKSKSLSTFLETDDTHTEIECKRRSYATQAKLNFGGFGTALLIGTVFSLVFMIWVLLLVLDLFEANHSVVSISIIVFLSVLTLAIAFLVFLMLWNNVLQIYSSVFRYRNSENQQSNYYRFVGNLLFIFVISVSIIPCSLSFPQMFPVLLLLLLLSSTFFLIKYRFIIGYNL